MGKRNKMEGQIECENCNVISKVGKKNMREGVLFKKGERFTRNEVGNTILKDKFFSVEAYGVNIRITYEILEDFKGLFFTCPICRERYAITRSSQYALLKEGKLKAKEVHRERRVELDRIYA